MKESNQIRLKEYFGVIFKKYSFFLPLAIAFMMYTLIFAFERYGVFASLLSFGSEKTFIYAFMGIVFAVILLSVLLKIKSKSINFEDAFLCGLLFLVVILTVDCFLFGRIFSSEGLIAVTPDTSKLLGDITSKESLGSFALIYPISNWTFEKTATLIGLTVAVVFLIIIRMFNIDRFYKPAKKEKITRFEGYYGEVFQKYNLLFCLLLGFVAYIVFSGLAVNGLFSTIINETQNTAPFINYFGAVVIGIFFLYFILSAFAKKVTFFDAMLPSLFFGALFMLIELLFVQNSFSLMIITAILTVTLIFSLFRLSTYSGNEEKTGTQKLIIAIFGIVIGALMIGIAIYALLNFWDTQAEMRTTGLIAVCVVLAVAVCFGILSSLSNKKREPKRYFPVLFSKQSFLLSASIAGFTVLTVLYAIDFNLIDKFNANDASYIVVIILAGLFGIISAGAILGTLAGLFKKTCKEVNLCDVATFFLIIETLFALAIVYYLDFNVLYAIIDFVVLMVLIFVLILRMIRIKRNAK